MEQHLMNTITTVAGMKMRLFEENILKYGVRCLFAGIYLTIGTAFGLVAAQGFVEFSPAIARIVYAIFFTIGLIVIVFLNGELATSNMMMMTISAHRKFFSYKKAAQLLLFCTLGNLIGAYAISFLLGQTTIFNAIDSNHLLYALADGKLAKSVGRLFIEAIIANIIVNIGIMGMLRTKEFIAKFIYLMGTISIFVLLGYEHLIANFSMFGIVQFTNPGALESFTASTILINWIIVLIGNYIGGGLIMGLTHSWLNQNDSQYFD